MRFSFRQIPRRTAALLVASLILFGVACQQIRTVYVPHGQPVRLREALHRVKIWAFDKDGQMVPGEMDLPEGWYVLPKE